MHTGIHIRLLGPSDLPVLARAAPDVLGGIQSAHWTAQALAQPHQHWAAALDDGVLVGLALGLPVWHLDKAPEYWLRELGVAATHRRLGLARALVQCLQTQARALGCRQWLVSTEPSNTPARALYTSLGARAISEPSLCFAMDL